MRAHRFALLSTLCDDRITDVGRLCTMAIRGTAAENAAKWKNRLTAATPDIQAGIQRVTVSPGMQAAKQKETWRQNVANSADKWERRVAAVTVDEWKKAALDGTSRVAQGAAAKVSKVEAFQAEFIPHLERVQQRLASMPRGNLEQNLGRMIENARLNAQFKRSGR